MSNNELLTAFVNALNGKDGAGSHLVSVPPGPHLSDALISSPVIQVCLKYISFLYNFGVIKIFSDFFFNLFLCPSISIYCILMLSVWLI